MKLLIFGLLLFIATHLIPAFPKVREKVASKLKPSAYYVFFSLFSLISVVIIVFGLKQAPYEALYDPPSWGRHLNMAMMLFAFYFFASNTKGSAPSSAKVFTAFPISWGVMIWSAGHLFANGDLAHVILFASFLIYSIISIVTGKARGLKPIKTDRPPLHLELVFVTIVAIVYAVLFWAHKYFTGMPLV